MYFPEADDYIDMHTHAGKPALGIFIIESLMAHESVVPVDQKGVAFTYGIHPWFLDDNNYARQIASVRSGFSQYEYIAVGEAGFDKLRGPSPDLQRKAFEEQAELAGSLGKPVIIHCVRAWDELLAVMKKMKPKTPWLIHGFRGSIDLANQLLSKGLYLSIWFEFALRPESSNLIKSLPEKSIFLETDGADVDIRMIYEKVAGDLEISVDDLKVLILKNFREFFRNQIK